MNTPHILELNEQEFWSTATSDCILAIKEAIQKHGTCRLGLAGGSTPKRLYEALAKEDLPWESITIILLDERYVPSDHEESNLKMIRKSLLNHVPIPPENILSFDTSLPQESAAKDMSRKLIHLTHDRFPLFDLLILGAGSDGHIASLFEGDTAMQSSYYATSAVAEGYPTQERLTMSLIALRASTAALLLLKGESKRPVLQALRGEADKPKLTALREVIEDVPLKVLFTA